MLCHLCCSGELDKATKAEAAAVEAEDFEGAAALSATADAAKARLADLQQAVRAVDTTCERLVQLRLPSHVDSLLTQEEPCLLHCCHGSHTGFTRH